MTNIKLKPEVKTAWLEALRSGDYDQTKGTLEGANGEGFCCLGVLCNLAEKAGAVERTVGENAWDEPQVKYAGASDMPPSAVVEWAFGTADNFFQWDVHVPGSELDEDAFYSTDEDGLVHTALQELNDEHGYSFAQLADLIEEQL